MSLHQPKIDPTVTTVHRPGDRANPFNALTIAFLAGSALIAGAGLYGQLRDEQLQELEARIERCASPRHIKSAECKGLATEVAKYKTAIEQRRAEETARREARRQEEEQRIRAEQERIRQENAWIPKGFEVSNLNSDVAYRWVENPQCSLTRCSQVEIVPKNGCSSLYAQADLVDNAGRNVGYANDLTSGVGPGQTALMTLNVTTDEPVRLSLNEINCY